MAFIERMLAYCKAFIKLCKPEWNLQYTTKSTISLSDEELQACSELFGSSYGKYNKESKRNPGGQIKMPSSYYRTNYCKPNFYVALVHDNDKLVGQAFYLRKDYSEQGFGIMTWVLQLVVDSGYKKRELQVLY